jgi:hypothetical protein
VFSNGGFGWSFKTELGKITPRGSEQQVEQQAFADASQHRQPVLHAHSLHIQVEQPVPQISD